MARKSKIKKGLHKKIASERIKVLFSCASILSYEDHDLADNYVARARKIAMKFRMRMPIEYKRMYCQECHSFFFWGENSRHRTRDGKVVVFCEKCRQTTRLPFYKERKQKRQEKLNEITNKQKGL